MIVAIDSRYIVYCGDDRDSELELIFQGYKMWSKREIGEKENNCSN